MAEAAIDFQPVDEPQIDFQPYDSATAASNPTPEPKNYPPEVLQAIQGVPRPAAPAMQPASWAAQPATSYQPSRAPDTPQSLAARRQLFYDLTAVPNIARGLKKIYNPAEGPAPVTRPDLEGRTRTIQPSQVESGASDVIRGGAALMMPETGAAALERPLSTAAWLGAGYGASRGAQKLVHGRVSPQAEQLIGDVAMVAPQAVVAASAPRFGVEMTPERSGAAVGVRGAGARVAVTPEAVTVRGKIGPLEGTKTFSRGAKPSGAPALTPQTIEGELAKTPPTREEIAEAQAATNYAGPEAAKAAVVEKRLTERASVATATGDRGTTAAEPPPLATVSPKPEGRRMIVAPPVAARPTPQPSVNREPKIDFQPHEVAVQSAAVEGEVITPQRQLEAVKEELRGQYPGNSEEKIDKAAREQLRFNNERQVAPTKASVDQESSTAPAETPQFKHRSTQVNIPEDSEAHTALETARARIADVDLASKGKDVGGNHLTVRWGLTAHDDDKLEKLKSYISSLSPFEATLGKTEKFQPSESSEGAAVIQSPVEAPQLKQIHDELEKHADFAPPTFDKYAPHATLAYVKPGRADRYVGMSPTAGKKFTVNSIAITDRQGRQEEVPLVGESSAPIDFQPHEVEIAKPEVIGEKTARPRTPGEPLELGFNHKPAEDLGNKVRQETERRMGGPLPRGQADRRSSTVVEGGRAPKEATPVVAPSVVSADKSNPEFGQAKRELYPGKTDLSDSEVGKVIDRAAEIAKEAKKNVAPSGAEKPVAGVEKVTPAEEQFGRDVKKRASALRREIARLREQTSAPAAYFQDSAKNAAAREERSRNIERLSEATKELEEVERSNPHEVRPLSPDSLPDRAKNKYAFQREYFTQPLQPVVDAWKAHLGPKYANAVKNGTKGVGNPPDFPERHVLVDIPGDGHFRVNNEPGVLEKVIRGASKGFAKPAVEKVRKPSVSREPSEPAKWSYLERMADEAVDAPNKEEKDAALETIENILGFTPLKVTPEPGTVVEYRGERYFVNGYASTYRRTVNLVPVDSPVGEATQQWAAAGRPKIQDVKEKWAEQLTRDKLQDAQEEAPLYLLKPVGKLTDKVDLTGEPRVVPGARSAHTGSETGTSTMQDLTASIARQVGEGTSLKNRLRLGADLGEAAEDAKDVLSQTLARLQGGMAALWDAYTRPPKWNDYEDATGKWSGADQSNALDLERFTKAIKDAVPEKLRREAISNWIEAGGDNGILRERVAKSTTPYKAGYEAALALTDAEKTIARNIMNRNEATLAEAQKAGLLQNGVENYVRHIYADQPKMVRRVMAEMNFNSLQTKPSFTKQRVLPTYFDAEQLGYKPKDKDVGFLTASHERAFREALAARDYIKSMMDGEASDGRPLVITSWSSAKELPAREAEGASAYLIRPNIKAEEEYVDYRRIDHPALRGWRWAGKTDAGEPLFVQGDALIHPEIYHNLKNNLSTSSIRNFEIDIGGHVVRPGAALLRVSSEIKHGILSFSGFHQTTLGIHALEHRTKPAGLPELDLNQPQQRLLVDHGLMVANYDAEEAFAEGLASGGIVTKIPFLGPAYHAYVDYLFKDYLPRVKMAMAQNAFARNEHLYGKHLSQDQLAALTAREANAAFGGLNYKLFGRNKTFQDVLRLTLMAPDFTEARARFAGQAARPYGREQLAALLGGALVLYTVARILNHLLDGQPHWDKPFALVHNGKEYNLRTVQGDILSAIQKPSDYVRNRLSPLLGVGIQALEGRDRFGHKQSLSRLSREMARNNVPIPLQPWTKESDDSLAQRTLSAILKMVGVSERQFVSDAMQKAMELRQENAGDQERTAEQKEHWREIRKAIDDYHKSNGQDYSTAVKVLQSGKLTDYEQREMEAGMEMPPIAFAVRGLPAEDVLQVFKVATAQEKRDLLMYEQGAFERVIEKHIEGAAHAESEDRESEARAEREEAEKLIAEMQAVASKPVAAAASAP